jgi:hypothetical protein
LLVTGENGVAAAGYNYRSNTNLDNRLINGASLLVDFLSRPASKRTSLGTPQNNRLPEADPTAWQVAPWASLDSSRIKNNQTGVGVCGVGWLRLNLEQRGPDDCAVEAARAVLNGGRIEKPKESIGQYLQLFAASAPMTATFAPDGLEALDNVRAVGRQDTISSLAPARKQQRCGTRIFPDQFLVVGKIAGFKIKTAELWGFGQSCITADALAMRSSGFASWH